MRKGNLGYHTLWFIGIGIVAMIVAVTLLTRMLNRNASATPLCPTDWAASPDREVTRACSALHSTVITAFNTQNVQTIEARPHVSQQSLAETVTNEPMGNTVTPGGIFTTPIVDIHIVDSGDAADGPELLRHTSSLWFLGKIPGHKPYYIDRVYILTREPTEDVHTTIAIVVDGSDVTAGGWPQYEGTWDAPQEMGRMKITNITGVTILPTGLTGTAVFTTTTGASGTFDLATHTWTITAAGTPVSAPQSVPSATVAPGASATPEVSATPEDTTLPYPAPAP